MAISLATFSRCAGCGTPQPELSAWSCARCGGLYQLHGIRYAPGEVDRSRRDLTRYAAFLPLGTGAVTLGAGGTPLTPARLFERDLFVKEEHRNPTGSFKDRGMVVLANLAAPDRPVFVDSVGNTAAALAALGRALGLEVHVFAPLSTSRERCELLAGYGARVHLVAGPRAVSNRVAIAASAHALYLSHIFQPLFQAGMVTCAFEIAEALGHAPGRVVLSVGQGTLFLGLAHGFRALVRAGVVASMPALCGVRPATPGKTVAVGAGAVDPLRDREYREAARASGGDIFSVPEEEIYEADAELRGAGFDVDPAASLAVAGWRRLARNESSPDVVVSCGAKREALPPMN